MRKFLFIIIFTENRFCCSSVNLFILLWVFFTYQPGVYDITMLERNKYDLNIRNFLQHNNVLMFPKENWPGNIQNI